MKLKKLLPPYTDIVVIASFTVPVVAQQGPNLLILK